MAKELDLNNDNLIDANLLGTNTGSTSTWLRGDQSWHQIYHIGSSPPSDTSLIWLDTSLVGSTGWVQILPKVYVTPAGESYVFRVSDGGAFYTVDGDRFLVF